MQAYTSLVEPGSLAERARILRAEKKEYRSTDPTAAERKRLKDMKMIIASEVSHEYRHQRRALAILSCVLIFGFLIGLGTMPIIFRTPDSQVKGMIAVIVIGAVLGFFMLCLVGALSLVKSTRRSQIESMSMVDIDSYLL